MWKCFTELPAKRQGSALVLSPKDEALDAVLETNESEIAGENGVVTIITRLNHLLKKDCTITKYHTFESFMTFKISFVMFIQDFLNEFDKHLFKTKTYGTAMPDNIFAYHLLKSANFSTHQKLIKAPIPDLQYNIIKDKLRKAISDASRQVPTKTSDIIKTEETFLAKELSNYRNPA